MCDNRAQLRVYRHKAMQSGSEAEVPRPDLLLAHQFRGPPVNAFPLIILYQNGSAARTQFTVNP